MYTKWHCYKSFLSRLLKHQRTTNSHGHPCAHHVLKVSSSHSHNDNGQWQFGCSHYPVHSVGHVSDLSILKWKSQECVIIELLNHW